MILSKKASAEHIVIGRKGESAACRLLEAKGLYLLVQNYRCPAGEIDIVARDGGVLVFVEVKSKRKKPNTRPSDNLKSKQKDRIFRAAKNYISEIEINFPVYRFDVIEVVFKRRVPVEIYHWENSFQGDIYSGRTVNRF